MLLKRKNTKEEKIRKIYVTAANKNFLTALAAPVDS